MVCSNWLQSPYVEHVINALEFSVPDTPTGVLDSVIEQDNCNRHSLCWTKQLMVCHVVHHSFVKMKSSVILVINSGSHNLKMRYWWSYAHAQVMSLSMSISITRSLVRGSLKGLVLVQSAPSWL